MKLGSVSDAVTGAMTSGLDAADSVMPVCKYPLCPEETETNIVRSSVAPLPLERRLHHLLLPQLPLRPLPAALPPTILLI